MEASFVGPLPLLIAPLRFSTVSHSVDFTSRDDGLSSQSLYKGGFPRKRNLPFLKRLRLKTIISLTPKPIEGLDQDVCDWARFAKVTLIHIKCEKPKEDGGGLSKEAAAKALLHIFDSRELPLYIHCLDGQSVSTLLIGVLRKIQAWSSKATIEEISRSLGHNDEVIGYQRSFIEKFGNGDGIRLPSRRFLPDWTWSEPSPLSRLKDPYDVILPRERQDRSSTLNGSKTPTNLHLLSNKKEFETNDDFFAIAGSGTNTSNNSPSALNYGIGNLPVQHPLVKLRFDHDAELPPPPVIHPLSTPLHTRDGGNNYTSPSSSRPSSRTGRHTNYSSAFHTHGHHPDLRSPSRPGSSQASPLMSVLTIHPSPTRERSPPLDYIGYRSDLDESRHVFPSSGGGSSSIDNIAHLREHPRVSALHHHLLHHESSTPTRSSNLSNTSTPRASISSPKNASPGFNQQHNESEELYGLGLRNNVFEPEKIVMPSVHHAGARNNAVNREGIVPVDVFDRKKGVLAESLEVQGNDTFVQQNLKQINETSKLQSDNRRFKESVPSNEVDPDRRSSTAVSGNQRQTGGGDDMRDEALMKSEEDANDEEVAEDGEEQDEDDNYDEEDEVDDDDEEEEDDDDDEEDREDENDGLALEALDLEGF